MMYLVLRTDNPEAELHLIDGGENAVLLASKKWQAHRELSATIFTNIELLLKEVNKSYTDLTGVACFVGTGSFTGIRIGVTVANALAATLNIPTCAVPSEKWLQLDYIMDQLQHNKVGDYIMPTYDRPATITQPKK